MRRASWSAVSGVRGVPEESGERRVALAGRRPRARERLERKRPVRHWAARRTTSNGMGAPDGQLELTVDERDFAPHRRNRMHPRTPCASSRLLSSAPAPEWPRKRAVRAVNPRAHASRDPCPPGVESVESGPVPDGPATASRAAQLPLPGGCSQPFPRHTTLVLLTARSCPYSRTRSSTRHRRERESRTARRQPFPSRLRPSAQRPATCCPWPRLGTP